MDQEPSRYSASEAHGVHAISTATLGCGSHSLQAVLSRADSRVFGDEVGVGAKEPCLCSSCSIEQPTDFPLGHCYLLHSWGPMRRLPVGSAHVGNRRNLVFQRIV